MSRRRRLQGDADDQYSRVLGERRRDITVEEGTILFHGIAEPIASYCTSIPHYLEAI
jgi:hypothetical protein